MRIVEVSHLPTVSKPYSNLTRVLPFWVASLVQDEWTEGWLQKIWYILSLGLQLTLNEACGTFGDAGATQSLQRAYIGLM